MSHAKINTFRCFSCIIARLLPNGNLYQAHIAANKTSFAALQEHGLAHLSLLVHLFVFISFFI
jgi:hypothetical protein